MNTLKVTVKERVVKGQSNFEGTVDLAGLKQTRIARKDGQTLFTTLSALKTVARNAGKSLNLPVEYVEPQLKAAKKSTTKKAVATTA